MPEKIEGRIVQISDSGNLITDISRERLADVPTDERVQIHCDEHQTQCIFSQDHGQPDFTLIAVVGNSGNLELEIVGDSAKIMLGISLGEKVVVSWE